MLNKTMLIGNLGADVELRSTKSKTAVANFRVATTERCKDTQGIQQEATEWHRIVAFGRLAEICGEYLAKGSRVYIEGRLQTRKWEDADGNTRFTTEIVAREMKMLGGGDKADHVPAPPEDGHEPPLSDDVPF
ncbi:MAG: single-stranded DNA-binding protein [Deltaproteobacteria bacterium RIFOXYD12_FULL_57_12]|nr:MAG: single-stranded DNA-binding protein [Deltaproteobacteria bacterium RIFOXYD12_FULL_57_12]